MTSTSRRTFIGGLAVAAGTIVTARAQATGADGPPATMWLLQPSMCHLFPAVPAIPCADEIHDVGQVGVLQEPLFQSLGFVFGFLEG